MARVRQGRRESGLSNDRVADRTAPSDSSREQALSGECWSGVAAVHPGYLPYVEHMGASSPPLREGLIGRRFACERNAVSPSVDEFSRGNAAPGSHGRRVGYTTDEAFVGSR